MTSPPGGTDHGDFTAERPALVCARCGTPADGPPPIWTCSVEGGVRRSFCDACSRKNLRSIEGRLDSAWW